MTIDQLIADLRLFPRQSLVVVETARTFAAIYAASPTRVHLDGPAVEPHHTTDCADATWFRGGVVIEHRFIGDIVVGIVEDGLTIAEGVLVRRVRS